MQPPYNNPIPPPSHQPPSSFSGYPPPPPPMPPPRKKNWFRQHPVWTTLIALFLLIGVTNNVIHSLSGASDTATNVSTPAPTQAPTQKPAQATPTPVPVGPSRATLDKIEADIASPYDPIVEGYDQHTATVRVASKFGTAIVVDPTTVKHIVREYMKGHFDKHKDVYIAKVTLQIYGTIRRGTEQHGYGVIARATMTRAAAQTIGWIFASDDEVWSKCTNTWMDSGVIENS